jgi:polysaccharide export outer membrane protein
MNSLRLIPTLLVLLAAIAPVTAAFAADPAAGDYRIGPEDILQISVWKNDAMTKTVPVRPDGKISLPLVNDVQAAGLTPLELRDVLAKGLAEYIPNPEVSVIVNEVRSFKVSVIGEVLKPSRYELKSHATILDALALAGGFTPFASRSRIVILRPEANGTMNRISFNYNKAISSGDGILDRLTGSGEQTANFYLRNGDVVVVP